MRKLFVILSALAFSAGCGGGGDATAPKTGILTFALDPVTCAGQNGNVELFIDSQSQGQFFFNPGTTKSFTVSAGTHVAGAQAINGPSFGSSQVNVPANGSFTLTMQC